MNPFQQTLEELEERCIHLPQNIPSRRLAILNQLAHWVSEQPLTKPTDIMIICTHNSRRSQMGQIWLQAAAWHFELQNVRAWSGGTEGTAFYASALSALRKQGVSIVKTESDNGIHSNPTYRVQLQDNRPSFYALSTPYMHPMNPNSGFAAVLVCDTADQGCPVVQGAAARFALPYVDPKISDGSAEEAQVYSIRSLEIGTEMFYVMMKANQLKASAGT